MRKLIIDTDPGIDDAIAITLAIKSHMFDILGITTVAGNCSLEQATTNALDLLEMLKREDILVYKGMSHALTKEDVDATYAHGNNGMGGVDIDEPYGLVEQESAIDYLIRSVNENPNQVTIAAIGPLTNIAMAIKKDENFSKNIKQLVIMGGANNMGNVTPYAEFNFYKDPDAAKIVFEAGIKDIVVCGLNVTSKNALVPELEQMLLDLNNPISKFFYDITRNGANFDRSKGYAGSLMHDAITIAYLLDESVIVLEDVDLTMIERGEREGESVISIGNSTNCKFAMDVDTKKFYRILFKTIFEEQADYIEKIIEKL